MTFEVDNDNRSNDQQESNVGANTDHGSDDAVGVDNAIVNLRSRQAALDVVLDGATLMSAQARLMGILDKNVWERAFTLVKEEVHHLRDELNTGRSFEELVMDAEDAGEDIQSLADRLGVSFDSIAQVIVNRDTVKL